MSEPTDETEETTSGTEEESAAEPCTTDADCSAGGTCNCRCAEGQPCDGPADACGDCAARNMVGVCRAGCGGG